MNYFDIAAEINASPNTRVFYVIGARGVGKSYSVKKWVVRNFLNNGERFVYNKRWTTEIEPSELSTVFDDTIIDPDVIEDARRYAERNNIKEYYAFRIFPRGGSFYFGIEAENGKLIKQEVMARLTCVSKATRIKGNVLNVSYTSIVFDEFITDEGYFHGRKEPEQFAKIVNTVGRANNENLRIFMIGNPDASIELNPYITGNLTLDYEHLQTNTAYYYDRKKNGRILARNVMFIKLAPLGDAEFLNAGTVGVWGTSEEEMSETGEVKTGKFINIDDINDNAFRPFFKIIMETPIIAKDEYRKKIYVYYGLLNSEPFTIVLAHDDNRYKNTVSKHRTIYSRVDELDTRLHGFTEMFRFNLPTGERWKWLHYIIDGVRVNRYIATDSNRAATIYTEIAQQSE